MTKLDLPFVDARRDRHGQVMYYYFRRNGRLWRLPGAPLSAEFMAAYNALIETTKPVRAEGTPGAYASGTFGALVAAYFKSPEFKNRKDSTKRVYRQVLEPLAERHGPKEVKFLERRHVKAWRNARSETPGMANLLVKVVRMLLAYAVDDGTYGLRENPASGIELFALGEHRAWTDEECAQFEARWAPGTMQRRAYCLARYTGQRSGDLAAMTRAHRKNGSIHVVQQKTGAELWLPEHSELAAELSLGSMHIALLTKPNGTPLGGELGEWFAAAIDEAGLPDECVLHGLRKTAARALADADCTPHQIAAITGHKSLKEVERYTKEADQKRMARAAILKLEQNANRTQSAKQTPAKSAKQKPSG
jgi:integrase